MSMRKNLGLFSPQKKLIVLGDIHADYEKLILALKKVKLINNKLKWIGGKTILIQIGDMVDGRARINSWKGDNDLKVINFFIRLRIEARNSGGNIIFLMGNHELMNYQGNFTYSGDNGIKTFGNEQKRYKYFRTKFKQFMKTSYLAIKIGDWVFCHAGIPSIISNSFSIPELNSLFLEYLDNKLSPTIEKKFLEITSSEIGILTNRKFGGEKINCKKTIDTLKNLKANHMVVGHTVQEKINCVCNHKVWRVDVGISRAFGSGRKIELLEINNFGKSVKII